MLINVTCLTPFLLYILLPTSLYYSLYYQLSCRHVLLQFRVTTSKLKYINTNYTFIAKINILKRTMRILKK